MPKLSVRPETRELIITLDRLIRNGDIQPSFKLDLSLMDRRFMSVIQDKSSYKLTDLSRNGKLALDMDNFETLARHQLLRMTKTNPLSRIPNTIQYHIHIEQSLHDLVDRDFEVDAPNPIVNVTAHQATVNIARADAVNLINNNVQLADALEDRLRAIISAEHAFIFDAINDLRTAVDNASKQTALQKVFGAASHINDTYGLIQIAIAIASLIRH